MSSFFACTASLPTCQPANLPTQHSQSQGGCRIQMACRLDTGHLYLPIPRSIEDVSAGRVKWTLVGLYEKDVLVGV